ncbi:hypothetical protein P7C71_g1468, partial [Lecanoromycetidae sp. Uapishka_2]
MMPTLTPLLPILALLANSVTAAPAPAIKAANPQPTHPKPPPPPSTQANILCFANTGYIAAMMPFTRAYAGEQIALTCRQATGLYNIANTVTGGIQLTLTTMDSNINNGDTSGADNGGEAFSQGTCEQGFFAAMDNCDTGSTQTKFGGATSMFGATFSIFGQAPGTPAIGK